MKKSDLKTGMWVKVRNGDEMRMVLLNSKTSCNENNVLTDGKRWRTLDFYTDDLKVPACAEYDITEVWLARYTINMIAFSRENFECIWKREETCHLTQNEAERILSETLGKKVEIKGGENALYRV